jgi:16S rRNA (adenine1518-N6/adenine1519-N6)-dimethyltransferase
MELSLLKRYEVHPNKRLGQNFLTSRIVLKKIIEAADLKPSDIVLEIGPGLGILTKELAKMVHPVKSSQSEVFAGDEQFNRVKKVIAIEKDQNLVRILNNELRIKNIKNVEIVKGDILKIDLKPYTLNFKSYKLVANLPYYITGPVIRMFLESANPPESMVLMVQKEVAQRIVARPPDMSILAVSVQFYAKPEIISYVSKKSFWPQPKVDSAILRITPLINADRRLINADLFFRIVKAGFSQPRKQLINNFSKSLELPRKEVETWLKRNKIQPSQRAETLTLKNWLDLANSYCSLF